MFTKYIMENIPISDIISGPLIATANAQMQLTNTTLDFIQSVGLDESNSIKTIAFTYDLNDGSTTTTMTVTVPLLSILKTPNLSIKSTEIDFNIEINEQETSTSNSNNQFAFLGRLTSAKKIERETNTTSTYSYKLVAEDNGPPEGLSRIMDILNNTIQ